MRRTSPPSAPAEVRFVAAACSLGRVLVALTEGGIAAVLLGDDDGSLAEELRARFPNALEAAPGPALDALLADVSAAVDDPARALAHPLDVRGTDFQRRVWDALRAVPPGSTTTYGQIAGRLGRPGAERAVGAACAANIHAVVIPCHRALRTDGGLGGYRWGMARKRTLLEREGVRRAAATS